MVGHLGNKEEAAIVRQHISKIWIMIKNGKNKSFLNEITGETGE